MELGGAQDAGGNRARRGGPLLDQLGGVVADVEVVGADDRDDEDALDAVLGAGLLQVAHRGREELGRPFGGGAGGGVDDQVDSLERRAEALAGDHVDPVAARDRDHLMPALAQDVDGVAAEAAGRARDGDLLLFACHGCLHSVRVAASGAADFYVQ